MRWSLFWFWCVSAHAGQTVVLPPVELAPGQTAQVNIMSSAASYPGWSFVIACQASVVFYGAGGSPLTAPATFTVGADSRILSVHIPYEITGAGTTVAPVTAQVSLSYGQISASRVRRPYRLVRSLSPYRPSRPQPAPRIPLCPARRRIRGSRSSEGAPSCPACPLATVARRSTGGSQARWLCCRPSLSRITNLFK